MTFQSFAPGRLDANNAADLGKPERIEHVLDLVELSGCKSVGITGLRVNSSSDAPQERFTLDLMHRLSGRGLRVCYYDWTNNNDMPPSTDRTVEALADHERLGSVQQLLSQCAAIIVTRDDSFAADIAAAHRGDGKCIIDTVGSEYVRHSSSCYLSVGG